MYRHVALMREYRKMSQHSYRGQALPSQKNQCEDLREYDVDANNEERQRTQRGSFSQRRLCIEMRATKRNGKAVGKYDFSLYLSFDDTVGVHSVEMQTSIELTILAKQNMERFDDCGNLLHALVKPCSVSYGQMDAADV